jgi:hypothetical protein
LPPGRWLDSFGVKVHNESFRPVANAFFAVSSMDEAVTFKYVFRLEDGRVERFQIDLDDKLELNTVSSDGEKPDWALLDSNKCPNCPLDSATSPYCPAALGISELLYHFHGMNSTDRATVEVHTPARTYSKETDLQDGLFSILGVIMPTSGCPALKFLRPMARFHLPFSTIHETEVRSVSFYLLRQYFDDDPGKTFADYLDELYANYEELQSVNRCLIQRIRMMERTGDVNKNAVIILMILSQMVSSEIKSHLKNLEYLFKD